MWATHITDPGIRLHCYLVTRGPTGDRPHSLRRMRQCTEPGNAPSQLRGWGQLLPHFQLGEASHSTGQLLQEGGVAATGMTKITACSRGLASSQQPRDQHKVTEAALFKRVKTARKDQDRLNTRTEHLCVSALNGTHPGTGNLQVSGVPSLSPGKAAPAGQSRKSELWGALTPVPLGEHGRLSTDAEKRGKGRATHQTKTRAQ